MGRKLDAALAAVALLAAVAISCTQAPREPVRTPESSTLAGEAERYVDIVLALRARDRDSVDFYAGPRERFVAAEVRNLTLAEIRTAASDLRTRLMAATFASDVERDRRDFMVRQLEAVIARVDLLAGDRIPFDDEGRVFFGVTVEDGDATGADRARAELERILPGRGTLAERYAAFDQQFLIPRDKLQLVLDRALAGCRRVTREHISLPDDESVTITYTRLMPWSAYADYQGGGKTIIRINLDYGLTVDRAFNLACHEAYPGHHTINTLIDTRLIGPLNRAELTVQPLFSPQSLRTEGAATFAPEVAFSDAERTAFERDELFPLAGLDPSRAEQYVRVWRLVSELGWQQIAIARPYIDGTLEFARAASALEDRALMTFPDATLKFFNQFRTYALTYTVGRDLVERAVNADGPDPAARWRNYERWITSTN